MSMLLFVFLLNLLMISIFQHFILYILLKGANVMEKSDYVNILMSNIMSMCQEYHISPNKLGLQSGAGKDIISNLQKGSIMSGDKLAKIADYLNCSVDYLLGRTEKQSSNQGIQQSISGSNHSTNNITFGEKNSRIIDEQQEEINAMLSDLNLRERTKLMSIIYDFYDKCKEQSSLQQKTYPVRTAARSGSNGREDSVFTRRMTAREIEEILNAEDGDEDL